MIRIRSSDRELELEGSGDALERLSAQLMDFAASDSAQQHQLPADSDFDPAPYKAALPTVTLCRSAGILRLGVVESSLRIEGRRESLMLLGRNIAELASWTPPAHIHLDAVGWPGDIAEDSLDLVLSLSCMKGPSA